DLERPGLEAGPQDQQQERRRDEREEAVPKPDARLLEARALERVDRVVDRRERGGRGGLVEFPARALRQALERAGVGADHAASFARTSRPRAGPARGAR